MTGVFETTVEKEVSTLYSMMHPRDTSRVRLVAKCATNGPGLATPVVPATVPAANNHNNEDDEQGVIESSAA